MSQTAGKNAQIYVGGLPIDINKYELKDRFSDFGNIRDIIIKRKYAFIVSHSLFYFEFSSFVNFWMNFANQII